MQVYLRKPSDGPVVQFSYENRDYEVFGSGSWKIIIYLIIIFVYLAIGFLLYRKCSSNSQNLQTINGDYVSVN
jgi:hypothetical protein